MSSQSFALTVEDLQFWILNTWKLPAEKLSDCGECPEVENPPF